MTAASPAADLLACVHCGHLDSGTYCSACGKELAATHKPVLVEAWEHLVVDRVQDVRALLGTAGNVVARPHRFFRTVLAGPAQRANHVFPRPGAAPLAPGLVQTPVKFLILGFVASLLASKVTGVEVAQWVPGADEDVNGELSLVILLAFVVLYGVLFHRTSGRRVSAEEASVFHAYLFGTNALISAVVTLTPARWGALVAAEGLLVLYITIVLPHRVLPRLYAIGRGRLLLAQAAAAVGAAVLLFGALAVLYLAAAPVRVMLGI